MPAELLQATKRVLGDRAGSESYSAFQNDSVWKFGTRISCLSDQNRFL